MSVQGAISGVGGALLKEGSGMLVLSGSNSYTGGTIVEDGTLVVTAVGALQAGTSLIVGADATSNFAAIESAAPQAPPESVPEPGTGALFIAAACIAGAYLITLTSRRAARLPSRVIATTTIC
jgi:autotransporter-associated beta strand protein